MTNENACFAEYFEYCHKLFFQKAANLIYYIWENLCDLVSPIDLGLYHMLSLVYDVQRQDSSISNAILNQASNESWLSFLEQSSFCWIMIWSLLEQSSFWLKQSSNLGLFFLEYSHKFNFKRLKALQRG